MKGLPKHNLTKVLWVAAIIMLSHINLSALIYFNKSEICFNNVSGVGGEIAVVKCNALRCYVIDGAGYFLDSHSDYLRFLQRIEVGERNGLDYNQLRLDLDSAIDKMLNAKDIYLQLKQTADMTPYNPTVLDQLLNFNYHVFRVENQLNEPIFARVRFFLCNGAIREMYGEILVQIENILNIADHIKERIDVGEFPLLSDLYRLNESYSESLLFGEYTARVFREILGN